MREITPEVGHIVRFKYDGKTAEGLIQAIGPKRVHIQSGQRGVYVGHDDLIGVVRVPDENEIPQLGERLRFSGGIDQ